MDKDSVMVVDGGDFVATAAYICRPRSPLSWLDPGVFGTLGVGGGFAVGAAICRPKAETWIIWGDGSAAYSLSEFDTCVRHGLPVIAVVGTDASWQQIAREQVEILGTPLRTELRRTDYHKVAEGYGGKGLLLDDPKKIPQVLAKQRSWPRRTPGLDQRTNQRHGFPKGFNLNVEGNCRLDETSSGLERTSATA